VDWRKNCSGGGRRNMDKEWKIEVFDGWEKYMKRISWARTTRKPGEPGEPGISGEPG